MRWTVLASGAAALAIGAATQATADPWKDESGHGRGDSYVIQPGIYGYHAPWMQPPTLVQPGCRTERRWEPSGEYKEETTCYNQVPIHSRGVAVLPAAPPGPSLTVVIPID